MFFSDSMSCCHCLLLLLSFPRNCFLLSFLFLFSSVILFTYMYNRSGFFCPSTYVSVCLPVSVRLCHSVWRLCICVFYCRVSRVLCMSMSLSSHCVVIIY